MKGYVTILDILGFSKKNVECPLEDIWIVINRLIEISRFTTKTDISTARISGTIDDYQYNAKCMFYADTLMIWENSDDGEIKRLMMKTVQRVMGYSYASKIPMRCGIAYGDFKIDETKKIFAGKAIVCAHDSESKQNWIGVGFHKSCLDDPWFKEQADDVEKSTINLVEYSIPINKKRAGSLFGCIKKRGKKDLLNYSMNWIPQIKAAQHFGQERNNILNYEPEHEKFQNFELFQQEMKKRFC